MIFGGVAGMLVLAVPSDEGKETFTYFGRAVLTDLMYEEFRIQSAATARNRIFLSVNHNQKIFVSFYIQVQCSVSQKQKLYYLINV